MIYAIDESPAEPGVIWAGTNDGRIHVTRDGGANWANVTENVPDMPVDGVVRNVDASKWSAGKAFMTVEAHQVGDFAPYVYRTEDFGASWTKIVNGIVDSPLSYTRNVREDPVRPGLVYLGTENYLYVSFDDGDAWQRLANGLPPSRCTGSWCRSTSTTSSSEPTGAVSGSWTTSRRSAAVDRRNRIGGDAPLRSAAGVPLPPDHRAVRHVRRLVGGGKPALRGADQLLARRSGGRDRDRDPRRGRATWCAPSRARGRRASTGSIGTFGANRPPRCASAPRRSTPTGLVPLDEERSRPAPRAGSRSSRRREPTRSRFRMGESEATASLELRKDPNSEGTLEDIAAQTAMLRAIHGDMNSLAEMVNEIEWLRRQVLDIKAVQESAGQADAVASAVERLRGSLIAVLERAVQLKTTGTGQDQIRYPTMLAGRLGYLAGVVGTADFAPNDSMARCTGCFAAGSPRSRPAYEEIMENGLPALNARSKPRAFPAWSGSAPRRPGRPTESGAGSGPGGRPAGAPGGLGPDRRGAVRSRVRAPVSRSAGTPPATARVPSSKTAGVSRRTPRRHRRDRPGSPSSTGVRRIEARLNLHRTPTGPFPGWPEAGPPARCSSSRRSARVEAVGIGRALIFGAGRRVEFPPHRSGFRWRSASVDSPDPDAAKERLQSLMRGAEADLASALGRDGWRTVVDGPLNPFRRSGTTTAPGTVGYVKTHHRRMLADEAWRLVPGLGVGERSGLFDMGNDLYGAYLRVGDPGPWAGPWAGIVRLDFRADAGLSEVVAAADETSGWLPAFTPPLHRDPRAPVNLSPIAGLERTLRQRQGDPRLAIRAVREAALAANRAGRRQRVRFLTETSPRVGLVDGSVESDSRSFHLLLDPDVVVQLDELIAVATPLADGSEVTHYGIVTELRSRFEGADLPSDTGRVVDATLPAELTRRAEVRVLRVAPERFVAPNPGAVAVRATGDHRTRALFEDAMERGRLPAGLDVTGAPVHVDMRFVDGRSGGHVSISGISGVATKTSYALFVLYQLLETERGLELLGGRAGREATRALVFNTKGEDLLHLDRPNSEFAERPDAREAWKQLGVDAPGAFRSIRLYAPRAPGAQNPIPHVTSRRTDDVEAYGWTPEAFVRKQLLQFAFTAADERATQVGFVEQQVRIQLLRRLRRLAGDPTGAVVILDEPPPGAGFDPDRLARRTPEDAAAGAGAVVRGFGDLIGLLERIEATGDERRIAEWFGRTQPGTRQAFLRRLMRLRRHLAPLIGCDLEPVGSENARVHVVDIARLHDDAQRFVVGALLDGVWNEKQGSGRTPLRFVVLDELNKYAPAHGYSPLKELLVDIAERGRSLGVLLIGAQQAASAVAPALPPQRVAEGGRPARRRRVRRLPVSQPGAARAGQPVPSGRDGAVPADRPRADSDPLSFPAVRHEPG